MTYKLIFILSAMFFAACQFQNNSLAIGQENSQNKAATEDEKTEKMPDWQNVKLGQNRAGEWRVNAEKLGESDLTDVYFTDVNNGWIIGRTGNSVLPEETLLYRTADGGKTWKKLDPNFPKNSLITNIQFISDKEGWLILNGISGTSGFTIMFTEDGGNSWKALTEITETYCTKLAFRVNGEGWLAGFRKTEDSPLTRGVIFHTQDFGKTWNDVSPTISNTSFNNRKNDPEPVSRWNDIQPERDFTAAILSDYGDLLKTADGGVSWSSINKISTDRSGAIKGLNDNFLLLKPITDLRFLAVSGVNGQEGIFAGISSVGENEIYQQTRLNDIYISDVAYLGNNEFIFCGSRVEQDIQKKRVQRRGIVFYTKDLKNWEVIHETGFECKYGCMYNKISVIGETILLAGNNGDLTRVAKIKN